MVVQSRDAKVAVGVLPHIKLCAFGAVGVVTDVGLNLGATDESPEHRIIAVELDLR